MEFNEMNKILVSLIFITCVSVTVFGLIYYTSNSNHENVHDYICANGFKSYYIKNMTVPYYDGIIPCNVNQFLPSGAVNDTLVNYYKNTFTGSMPKAFKLDSSTPFTVLVYEESNNNYLIVGQNNDTFTLIPNQSRYVEVMIDNYSMIDTKATAIANGDLIKQYVTGYSPFFGNGHPEFDMQIDLGKGNLAKDLVTEIPIKIVPLNITMYNSEKLTQETNVRPGTSEDLPSLTEATNCNVNGPCNPDVNSVTVTDSKLNELIQIENRSMFEHAREFCLLHVTSFYDHSGANLFTSSQVDNFTECIKGITR